MKKFLSTLLLLFLLLALAGGAALVQLRRIEREHLYHPDSVLGETPADHHLRYQSVRFRASDGVDLQGWWIPCRSPRATLVYCRGNAGNRSLDAQWAPFFAAHRLNVFLWDYRGYGDSAGKPSEDGFRRDAQAAFDAAADSARGLPVLAFGHSLGAAVAAQLALDRPVAGLILDSAFASAADMARRRHPKWTFAEPFLSVSYDTAARTALLSRTPKIFGHSPTDGVIPFQSGRTLYAAAAAPKSFVLLEGGHDAHSWFRDGGAGNAELCAFLSRWETAAPAAP
jgi:hypothetical protein